jgi:hypothetical protein
VTLFPNVLGYIVFDLPGNSAKFNAAGTSPVLWHVLYSEIQFPTYFSIVQHEDPKWLTRAVVVPLLKTQKL